MTGIAQPPEVEQEVADPVVGDVLAELLVCLQHRGHDARRAHRRGGDYLAERRIHLHHGERVGVDVVLQLEELGAPRHRLHLVPDLLRVPLEPEARDLAFGGEPDLDGLLHHRRDLEELAS